LKIARGNVGEALKNELSRINLNRPGLLPLIMEYCHKRGLLGRQRQATGKRRSEREEEDEGIEEKVEQLRKVRKLTNDGEISAVLSTTDQLNPSFSQTSPHLYFQLKQCEFVECINNKQIGKAMEIARKYLGPLSVQYPELVPDLKETTLLLALPADQLKQLPVLNKVKASTLAGPLFTALGNSIGLQEPKLCKILKYLLWTHSEWFKQQMCEDSFNDLFELPHLKRNDSCGKEEEVAVVNNSVQMEEDSPFDDKEIIKLMEWTALTRREAIALMTQYQGNLDEIFATLLS